MADPYPLRPVTDEEFDSWARMIADTYGVDRSDEELANQRAATDLARTLAAFEGDAPVSGASVYARTLTVPGAVVPVAGIASVGVAPTHRRRGILTSMMRRQLTDIHEQGLEPIAALRPSEAAIYGRYGFGLATRGNRLRCDKRAMRFRPGTGFGDGTVRLLPPAQARPMIEKIYDQVRTMSVGWPDRAESHWNIRLFDQPAHGMTMLRYAVHLAPDNEPTGYALYRHAPGLDAFGNEVGSVQVAELAAHSRTTYAALWRYLAGIDLASWIDYEGAPDEPLAHLVEDARAVHDRLVDRLWVRLVDVGRALSGRRYSTPLDIVLDVEDHFCPWNTGRYHLQADSASSRCERTRAPADLRLTSTELGAAYLGGTTLAALARAGLVEELRAGALARASVAFRHDREPHYPGGWAFPLY
ncbi:GNAT family N-acetyltransferase [Nocardia transvalensis]|uniref:GNAT family N-acetyltransferase n=1 Tax=Nocardia transvalensis TaxID=37333 RepID=UPI001895061D|nr:GNAT family N-acetyltransferase [Nocardia transvalensis]MBF6327684.1 GNAT family N-acetyltransferase [Nocardia transvalensis]